MPSNKLLLTRKYLKAHKNVPVPNREILSLLREGYTPHAVALEVLSRRGAL